MPTAAGATKFLTTCGQPSKNGRYGIKITYKPDGGKKRSLVISADILKTDTPVQKATKIVNAFNAAVNALAAAQRPAVAGQPSVALPAPPGGGPAPTVLLPNVYYQNNAGWKITKRKELDRTGQKASIRQLALLPGQGKSNVALALKGTAAGTLGLTVDTGETVSSVSIALDDLTILQAAQAIAERLTADGVAASVSDTPLLPDLVFDGEEPADTEIQIFGMPDPTITIDLTRTGLDVQFSEDLDVVSLEDFVDKSFQKKELTEIAESPISVLRGVSKADADRLRQAFNVKTVRDLANLKFVDWARKIVDRE